MDNARRNPSMTTTHKTPDAKHRLQNAINQAGSIQLPSFATVRRSRDKVTLPSFAHRK